MREHAADSRDYEMMIVIAPTVAEDGLAAAIDRVGGYITSQGGTVRSTNDQNPWGRRRLAYPIQDFRDAFYVLYRFDASTEAIDQIDRAIKLDEQVIRHLIVRYDEMAEHEERPRRDRGRSRFQPAEAAGQAEEGEAATQPAEPAAVTEVGDAEVEPLEVSDETEAPEAGEETESEEE